MKKRLLLVLLLVFTVGCSEIDAIKEEKTKQLTDPILDIEEECTIPATQRQFNSEQYYTGPLIDSHIHMPVASNIVSKVAISSGFEDMPSYDDISIDYLECLFESEGIKKVFGFSIAPNMVFIPAVNKLKSIQGKYPQMFVNFYMPTQLPGLNPDNSKVEQLLIDNPNLYHGYGEVKFSFNEIDNYGIDDEEYLEAYQLADDYNLMIMMHPGSQHQEEVTALLEKHPNVNFLFHGGEINTWIVEVLENYDNAYYTVEVSNKIFGWSEQHAVRGPTKEEFVDYMNNNFASELEDELMFWKKIMEEHPDKFLWGTDRWYGWHFDQEVGAIVEEFSRAFIGSLNEDVQEKFAYKNAEKLIGG